MATQTENKMSVDLAVYMERLDTYIDTQSRLNETLCRGMDKVNNELDEIKHWRTKFYGAKSLAIFAGILFAHAAVVMGTVIGLVEIFQD